MYNHSSLNLHSILFFICCWYIVCTDMCFCLGITPNYEITFHTFTCRFGSEPRPFSCLASGYYVCALSSH